MVVVSLEERVNIADYLRDRGAPALEALPELSIFLGGRRDLSRQFSHIADSGGRALRRVSEQLLADLPQLDEVLPDFDLAGDILQRKLDVLQRINERWTTLWERARSSAARLT